MTAPTSSHPSDPDVPLDAWLLDRVAAYLNRPADTIEPDVPLAEYGMDSVMAMSLCGDLEDERGLEVEPTLLWDHPTMDALRSHLAPSAPALAPSAAAPGGRSR